jgi:hypothetical protein
MWLGIFKAIFALTTNGIKTTKNAVVTVTAGTLNRAAAGKLSRRS